MPSVRERMVKFHFGLGRGYDRREFTARFWIATDENFLPSHDQAKDAIQRAVDAVGTHWTVEQITNHLGMTVRHCNAVEVLNSQGDGLLLYPEWP